ncbi:MAG: hypothetical protein AABX83_00825 [Nanoarchaeota archaeon]
MNNVFEVIDKKGRKIRLTQKQWLHINHNHPDVKQEEIEQTIGAPLKIVEKSKNKLFYYRFFKYKSSPFFFLRVIVKYLNSEGFIITSYFVKEAH